MLSSYSTLLWDGQSLRIRAAGEAELEFDEAFQYATFRTEVRRQVCQCTRLQQVAAFIL